MEVPHAVRGAIRYRGLDALLMSSCGLLTLLLSAADARGGPLNLAREIDCDAVNSGSLNVELAGMERTSRTVSLRAGETLDFALETVDGPLGSLTQIAGAGAPRPLLAGPTGTTVKFMAPEQDTFGFEFAIEGEADAAFTVSCTRQQAASRKGTAAARHAAKLLAETPELRQLPELETPADGIDWSAAQDSRPSLVRLPGSQRALGSFSTVRQPNGFEMWLQAKDKRFSLVEQPEMPLEGDAAAVSGGGLNYKLLPEIMVGALVQFDEQGEQFIKAPRSLSEQGWMAGPVTSVQLAPGISLDARAAWGESEPATPFAAASGPGADRRLVNARLANTQRFGHWWFSPSVVVDYHEETQYSADPSDGGPAAQTVGFGRVDIRPELGYRLDLDQSTFIEPKAAVSGFWDIDGLSNLGPDDGGHEDVRLKAEAGVTVGTTAGTKLQAMGGVEEGGAGAADIWSGRFRLSVPLK